MARVPYMTPCGRIWVGAGTTAAGGTLVIAETALRVPICGIEGSLDMCIDMTPCGRIGVGAGKNAAGDTHVIAVTALRAPKGSRISLFAYLHHAVCVSIGESLSVLML